MSSSLKATVVACAALSAMLPPAFAHTIADPNEGVAGAYLRTAFRVTHGCKGSPTVAVTIRIPEAVVQAKPMPKPGWTIEIKTRPLDPPVDSGHGFKIRSAVTEVTWRGGPLDNAHFDEFVVSLRLPDGPAQTLYFPTTQICEQGRNEWTEIPKEGQRWHELPGPAPFILLKKAGAGHAH
jgi:periplasmic copper chaperone A